MALVRLQLVDGVGKGQLQQSHHTLVRQRQDPHRGRANDWEETRVWGVWEHPDAVFIDGMGTIWNNGEGKMKADHHVPIWGAYPNLRHTHLKPLAP